MPRNMNGVRPQHPKFNDVDYLAILDELFNPCICVDRNTKHRRVIKPLLVLDRCNQRTIDDFEHLHSSLYWNRLHIYSVHDFAHLRCVRAFGRLINRSG